MAQSKPFDLQGLALMMPRRFLEAVRIREEAKIRREQATAAMKTRSQSTSGPAGGSGGGGLSLQEQMERRRSAMGGGFHASASDVWNPPVPPGAGVA